MAYSQYGGSGWTNQGSAGFKLTLGGFGGWGSWDAWDQPVQSPTPTQTTSQPPATSVVTGIDPSQVHNALYGKVIPISAFGLARWGTAGLIYGPYFSSGTASFGVSFGFPANIAGSRRVYEVSLDSKVAWQLDAGSPPGALSPGGFVSEPFTCRFYGGSLTQAADPLEIAQFGAQAVAYRPQMMLWFENLPLAQFDNKVPFVSAKLGDVTDAATPENGINLGDALTRFATSPWLEYTTGPAGTFEVTGVTDIVQGMILTEDQTFLNLLTTTSSVYRSLDILQTDKLKVVDRGANMAPDITFTRDTVCGEYGVNYARRAESDVPRELELMTVDQDADYVFVPSKAARPREPVPVTSSVRKDSITLPVIIDAATRASLVHFAKYYEDAARKTVRFSGMVFGYQVEPGDLIALSGIADGFEDEVFKVTETSHDANYEISITAQALLNCAIQFPIAEHVTCVNALVSPPVATHTFSAVALGAADPNRVSVVGVNIRLGVPNTGHTITAVTVNGVAATEVVVASNIGAGLISAIWRAATPSGTAGDIVITTSGNFGQLSAHVYRLVSAAVAVEDTASNQGIGAAAMAATVDATAGGIVIAAGATHNGAAFTWGNADADCTFVNTAETTGQRSSASARPGVAGPFTVSIDPLSIDYTNIAVAAFSL